MDLLQGVKDMEDDQMQVLTEGEGIPSMDNMAIPSVEELLKALDGMTGISEEDKESLRAQLTSGGGIGGLPATGLSLSQFFILVSLLLVVACIFGKIHNQFYLIR